MYIDYLLPTRSEQIQLHLALAISPFKATDECIAQIVANRIFAIFWPFIVNEFVECNKQNIATAKSVGFGIANSAITMEAAEQAAKMAWAMAELANAFQNNQNEQL